jgi:DNA-binding transcriptional regulator/RsmH inhibitor MraZ
MELQPNMIPIGVGDAPSDDKWRIRLPSSYALYFLAHELDRETAKLYVATLDAEDVLIWPKAEFLKWRSHLQESSGEDPDVVRNLLLASQIRGGESEIDRQGRFVLPKNVREALRLPNPKVDFKVLNDGVVRLTTAERLNELEQKIVPPSRELSDYAISRYARFLARPRQNLGADHA